RVENSPAREFGRARVLVNQDSDLFSGLTREMDVWMSHGDQVSQLSNVFVPLARTRTCPYAAVKHRELPVYGLQFHPEVTHSPLGGRLLHNFLTIVCQCAGTWRLGDFCKEAIDSMRKRIGKSRVICG